MTEYITLPPELMKEHDNTTVAIDVMYVNKTKFVVITSWGVRFIMT